MIVNYYDRRQAVQFAGDGSNYQEIIDFCQPIFDSQYNDGTVFWHTTVQHVNNTLVFASPEFSGALNCIMQPSQWLLRQNLTDWVVVSNADFTARYVVM